MTVSIIIALTAITAIAYCIYTHRRMKRQCHLMLEAQRNHDYTFRLSTHGWWGSNRHAIENMNDMMTLMANNRLDTELDSWVRLTHILTHEIMNSATPIASLSDTLARRSDVRDSDIADAVDAINDTAHSLLRFVDSYRKYTLLPKPDMQTVRLDEIIESIHKMQIVPKDVRFEADISPADLCLECDPTQTRQVLINIIKNAVENFDEYPIEQPHIALYAHRNYQGNIEICIKNNGKAIDKDKRRQIFVPFYTTKTTGTGIGLPLSQQILHQQNARLSLEPPNTNGWSTIFIITFEKTNNLKLRL